MILLFVCSACPIPATEHSNKCLPFLYWPNLLEGLLTQNKVVDVWHFGSILLV